MNSKKVIVCVGTRPNFIKIIKLKKLFEEKGISYKLLHTGQHFDKNMSDVFFEQLKLGKPDLYLNVSASSINETTGRIIIESSKVFNSEKPDMVIVVGDVNSTFACSYSAASLDIPVAHIESGLRSNNLKMPEERNRILTDNLSSLLLVTEEIGVKNLINEGFDEPKVKLVGNPMIDALIEMLPVINKNNILNELCLTANDYAVCTIHRMSNVDDEKNLESILNIINDISKHSKIVFSIHPRTKKNISVFSLNYLIDNNKNIVITEPLGYIEFMALLVNCSFVISDSGGIQTESSYLNKPCITLREETELISTIEYGTNVLASINKENVVSIYNDIRKGNFKNKKDVKIWDGKSSERIVNEVIHFLN